MAKRGKIDELYELSELQKQHEKAISLVKEWVSIVEKANETKIGFKDSNVPSENIKGIQAMAESNKKYVATANEAAQAYSKFNAEVAKLSPNIQENIKTQIEYKNRLKELSEQMKQLTKDQQLINNTKGNDEAKRQIKERIQALAQEQAQLKLLNSELVRFTNSQIKDSQTTVGSINQAKAAVALLIKERDDLNITTEEGTRLQEKYNEQIDKLNAFIEKNVDALSQRKINVGNYQGSAKIIVDALKDVEKEIANLQQKQAQMAKWPTVAGFQTSKQREELNQVNAQLDIATQKFTALSNITSNPQFLNVAGKVGDTNKELKFFTQRLNELEDAGLKNSDVYKEIQQRLAELTDQIGDTRAEIKALSSDTRSFDLFAGSVTFAADAFQTAAGAAALFGASQEDVAKVTQTLIAVQSVANGVKGIANELSTKGTAANKAYNYVIEQGSIIFGRGATAAQRFSAALKFTGIGLAITGITMLISKISSMSDETKAAEKAQQDFADAINEVNNALQKQIDLIDPGYSQSLNTLKDQLNFAEKSGASQLSILALKKKVAEEEKKIIDEQVKAQENLLIGNTNIQLKNKKGIDALIEGQNYYLQNVRTFNERIISLEKERALAAQEGNASLQERIEKDIEVQKKWLSSTESTYNAITNLIKKFNSNQASFSDLDAEAAKMAKERAAARAKELKDQSDARIKALLEIFKIENQESADYVKQIVDNEKVSFEMRLTALKVYADIRTAGITRMYEDEAKLGKKSNEEIRLLNAQKLRDINQLNDEIIRISKEVETSRYGTSEERQQEQLDSETRFKNKLDELADGLTKKFEEQQKERTRIAKEESDKQKEIEKQKAEYIKQIISETTALAFTLFTANIERQKNAVQEQIDALDKQKEKDIEVVNQTVINRKDAADQIAIIEARAQAQKDQLQRRQRELDIQKAKFDKAKAIADIIQGTAVNIIKAIGTGNAGLIALAASLGAVQLATVIAQPIPKYKHGKNKSDLYEGPAIVDDGGVPEAIIRENGNVEIGGNKPRLTYLNSKDIVHPDANKWLASLHNRNEQIMRQSLKGSTVQVFDTTELECKMDVQTQLLQAIKNKKEIHFEKPGAAAEITRFQVGNKEYFRMNGFNV